MKTLRWPIVPALSAAAVTSAAAQSVPPLGKWTLIAHGRTGNCDYPANYNSLTGDTGWMKQLGNRIESLNPGSVNVYKLDWSTLSLTTLNVGGTHPLDPKRHHVVLYDWGATSDLDPILCQAPSGNQNGFAFAAGDAMIALLNHWNATDRVFGLIGFSRGAVVVSEAARRLMALGHNPAQVLFIDGEGCQAGGTNGCTFYSDGRFDAWAAPSGSVRFDNLYETLNERYLAPALCATNLGGHERPRCGGINVGTTFAHTTWSLTSSCFPSYSQASVLTFVTGGLTVSGGFYTLPQAPSPVQDPNPPLATSEPIEIPFNGALGFVSLAGWAGQGGSGTGTISSLAGTPTLRMTRGQSRVSNFLALPECNIGVSFAAAVEGVTPGDSVLSVTAIIPGEPDAVLTTIPLSALPASLSPQATLSLPTGLAGRTIRFRFSVTGTTGTAAAHIANITTTCQTTCYANCDGSTASPRLTANDFQCFLNRFAAADSYANCDQSTSTPALTSNDFQCFLNSFAAGCT